MTIQERKEKARRKEELLKDLKALAKSDDPEDAHYKADALLVEYIDDVNIKDAWMAIPRWYA